LKFPEAVDEAVKPPGVGTVIKTESASPPGFEICEVMTMKFGSPIGGLKTNGEPDTETN
jgi:hypothetical protein